VAKSAQRPIEASRRLSAPPEIVLNFLADLDNHVLLAPTSVRVLSYDRQDGVNTRALVRMRGPLGIHRTASTELLRVTESSIIGRAKIGDDTVATVVWRIHMLREGSYVTLCATVDAASLLDALLLRFGVRRWLARRFAAALEQLSQELGTVVPPEDLLMHGCARRRPFTATGQ
jgi:Polyketide cyclase / dehydrase and lipid transport